MKKLWHTYYNFFDTLIAKINSNSSSLFRYLIGLLFVINLRNLLEYFSAPYSPTLEVYLHYTTFYIALALAFTTIIVLVSRLEIPKVIRAVTIGFFVILVPPIIDLTVSGGTPIHYFRLMGWTDFWYELRSLWLFKPGFTESGITLGIRMETILAVIFVLYYVFFSTKSIFRAVITGALIYMAIFLSFTTPFWLSAVEIGIFNTPFSESELTKIYTLFAITVCVAGAFVFSKKDTKLKAILDNIRGTRLVFIFVLGIIGFLMATKLRITAPQIHSLGLLFGALLLSWLSIVLLNDVDDYELDKINAPERPLAQGICTKDEFLRTSLFLILVAVIVSYITSPLLAMLILAFNGLYYLYTAKPFRLKAVPILSKIVLTAAFVVVMLAGYGAAGTEITNFPFSWPFIIFFALAINFIDLKDYHGDKAHNIYTLPVLLGEKHAKFITGLFFVAGYSLIFIYTENIFLWIIFLALGLLQFMLINKESYNEKPILAILLVSFFIIAVAIARGWLTI